MTRSQRWCLVVLLWVLACGFGLGWIANTLQMERQTGCIPSGIHCVIPSEDLDP